MRLLHCVVIKILRIRTHIALFFAVHFAALSLSLCPSLLTWCVCVCVRVLPYRLADFTCRTTTLALACEIKLFVGSRRIKIKFLLFLLVLLLLLLLLLTLLEMLLLLRPRAEASVTVTAAQPQSHHAPIPHPATRVMKCRRAAVTWRRLRSSSQPGFFRGLHVARGGREARGRGLAKRERSTFCGKLS